MTKWTLAHVHFFVLNIPWRQNGCWAPYTSTTTKWAMVYRTLFHFECFAKMAHVHFLVLDVSRRQNGRWNLYTFSFKMIRSGKNGSLYTVQNHTHTTVRTKRTLCVAFQFPFVLTTICSSICFALFFAEKERKKCFALFCVVFASFLRSFCFVLRHFVLCWVKWQHFTLHCNNIWCVFLLFRWNLYCFT